MRQFNIDFIKPEHVYRIYKENNDLVILSVDRRETRFTNLTEEEMKTIVGEIKSLGIAKRYNLEVYNDRYEAENH